MEDRKTGTRKVGDIIRPCVHPEHNPPMHMVYADGLYEHICPGCGKKSRFSIDKPIL
jgi:hypothetical protein